MSIYVKIKDKNFKTPSRIVIGRGAPFDLFQRDEEISRAHILLFKKGGEYFVKLLAEDADFRINNVFIEYNRPIKLNLTDKMLIGKHHFEILVEKPEKYTEIQRSNGSDAPETNYMSIVCAVSASVAAYLLSDLIAALIVGAGVYFIYRTKLNNLPHKVKEIFLSEDGFTTHFENGKNMSFRWELIESWGMAHFNQRVVIVAYGKRHTLELNGGFKALATFLEDRLRDKRMKQHGTLLQWSTLLFYAGLGFLNIVTSPLTQLLTWAYALFFGAAVFKENLRPVITFGLPPHKHLKKICIGVSVFLFSVILDSQSTVQNYSHMDACKAKDFSACEKVNFPSLISDERAAIYVLPQYRLSKQFLIHACNHSNTTACQLVKRTERAPASKPQE